MSSGYAIATKCFDRLTIDLWCSIQVSRITNTFIHAPRHNIILQQLAFCKRDDNRSASAAPNRIRRGHVPEISVH
jgi:hypothetical protein